MTIKLDNFKLKVVDGKEVLDNRNIDFTVNPREVLFERELEVKVENYAMIKPESVGHISFNQYDKIVVD